MGLARGFSGATGRRSIATAAGSALVLAALSLPLVLVGGAGAQTPGPGADLGVTKVDSADPVKENADLTYTLNVTNAGPSFASGVELVDRLPASADFRSASSGCTASGQTVTCDVGLILPGQSEQVQIVVRPRQPGTITNSATVSGDQSDPDPTDNDAVEATVVQAASVDLGVTKADAPDPVSVNEILTYTLTATNATGQDTASGVRIEDTLPSNVDFVDATAGCTAVGRAVTCQVGDLAAGGSRVFQIRVRPRQTGTITNTATIAGNETDVASGNNSDSEDTTVDPQPTTARADLDVDKTDSADPVAVGQLLTYTVRVRNAGPQSASNVTVTDDLPDESTFESASSGCANQSGIVTCQLGAIDSGQSKSVEIRVRPTAAGSIQNTAFVSSSTGDDNATNNDAIEFTRVEPRASTDLRVKQGDDPNRPEVGERLTYTVDVRNRGPRQATGVKVTDSLPEGVDFISASKACDDPEGGVVTCNVGTLAAGANDDFEIRVRPKTPGEIVNAVTVDGDQDDPDPANDDDTESTTVKGDGDDGPECDGKQATIVGTSDVDELRGTSERDVILAKGGNDEIRGLAGDDIVCAGGGDDVVRGNGDEDRLFGQKGDDKLKGQNGSDKLEGAGGDDRLDGGSGRDRCDGGTGRDRENSC